MLKKFGYLIGLFAYILGLVGGIGYALYSKAYIIAICIAALGGMALPTAKKWLDSLLDR